MEPAPSLRSWRGNSSAKVRLHGLWLIFLVSAVDAKTTWIGCEPFHAGRELSYANGRFILHNNSIAEGYHSKDGLAWTSSRDTGLTGSFRPNRVVFLQNRFNALFSRMEEAYRTSDDGLHWTNRQVPFAFTDMTWGQGMLVGTSRGSPNQLGTSPDGFDWTTHEMGNTQSWDRICYGNGVFVAVSFQGPIAVSSDAKTWKIVQGNYGSGDFRNSLDIRFGNGMFVIMGDDGRTLTSTDGAVWKESTPFDTPDYFHAMLFEEGPIAFGTGIFLVGDATDAGTRLRSTDGRQWTRLQNDAIRKTLGGSSSMGRDTI